MCLRILNHSDFSEHPFTYLTFGEAITEHRHLALVQIDRCMYGFGEIEPNVLVPPLNGAIFRSLGDTGTKMAPSLSWDLKLSNEGSFVNIRQEMTKLG